MTPEAGASWSIGSITEWGRYPFVVKRVGLPDWEGYADTEGEAQAIINDLVADHGPARQVKRTMRGSVG